MVESNLSIMELDFKTVRALSSPTRIRILDSVLDKEATPTGISDKVGKTKSTVSSHLEKLVEAELVEKDEEEGRRRVVYRPTSKAKAIVEGRERKVKFALTSSAFTGILGVSAVSARFLEEAGEKAYSATDSAPNAMTAMSQESMDAAGSAEPVSLASTALLLAGIGLILFSVAGLAYGLVMRRLGQ